MKIQTNTEWIQQSEAYLKRCFPDRSTAKHYVSDLHLFVQYHAAPLIEVTIQEVDQFVDQQYAQGIAPVTVKRWKGPVIVTIRPHLLPHHCTLCTGSAARA